MGIIPESGVCLVLIRGALRSILTLAPFSRLLDLLAQDMNLLAHLKDVANTARVNALTGQFDDLFKDGEIVVGVEAIFPRLACRFKQSGFLVAPQYLWGKSQELGDDPDGVFGHTCLLILVSSLRRTRSSSHEAPPLLDCITLHMIICHFTKFVNLRPYGAKRHIACSTPPLLKCDG